jgi:hypothetical protein
MLASEGRVTFVPDGNGVLTQLLAAQPAAPLAPLAPSRR